MDELLADLLGAARGLARGAGVVVEDDGGARGAPAAGEAVLGGEAGRDDEGRVVERPLALEAVAPLGVLPAHGCLLLRGVIGGLMGGGIYLYYCRYYFL